MNKVSIHTMLKVSLTDLLGMILDFLSIFLILRSVRYLYIYYIKFSYLCCQNDTTLQMNH
jgi:hypothetical protein